MVKKESGVKFRSSTPNATTTAWPQTVPMVEHETQTAPEPEPDLYVYGRRVSESDVKEMLRLLGDEELLRYERGEIPKAVAFKQARYWLRQVRRHG